MSNTLDQAADTATSVLKAAGDIASNTGDQLSKAFNGVAGAIPTQVRFHKKKKTRDCSNYLRS